MRHEAVHREAMRQDECVDLLSRNSVGRVVFTRHAIPDVLPVRFVYDSASDTIRIPAPHGSRLAESVDGTVVALQVEELEPGTLAGRSVLVHGRAEAGTAGALIRLRPELISGRILADHLAPGVDGPLTALARPAIACPHPPTPTQ